MSIFAKVCQAASEAQEKNLISEQLAERVCAIGCNRLNYKHLGLELHGLVAELTAIDGKGPNVASLESMVRCIEDKHRRI